MSCSIVQFFRIAYDFDAHRVSVLLCLFPLVARLNLLTVAEPSGLQPMNSAALLCGGSQLPGYFTFLEGK